MCQESNEILLVFECPNWCYMFIDLKAFSHQQISCYIKLERGSVCTCRPVWVDLNAINKSFALHWSDYGLCFDCSENFSPKRMSLLCCFQSKSISNVIDKNLPRNIQKYFENIMMRICC